MMRWLKRADRRACDKVWIAVSLLGLMVGCSEAKPKANPRGLLDPSGNPREPAAVARASAQAPEAAPGFQPLPSPFDKGSASNTGSATDKPVAAPADAAPAAPKRDLSAELLALLPAPAECLDLAKAAQTGKFTLSVGAMVMPGGSITRVTARAPGQSTESMRCVEAKVIRRALAPDVPDAPVQVQASLPVEVFTQAVPRGAAAPIAAPSEAPPELARPENGEVAQPDGNDFAQPSQ
jgi:hypothetical protein